MAKQWAIGDVHGCLKTLRCLVEERLAPAKDDALYFLGDYVSKGPDSRGVIDYLWQLQAAGFQLFTLMGNHEEMMLTARTNVRQAERLSEHGGRSLLRSFGVEKFSDVPSRYYDWLEKLPSFLVLEHFVLVHAGLDFKLPNPFTDTHAMRWIRHCVMDPEYLDGRVLLHGHTPTNFDRIDAQLRGEPLIAVNLDNGCVYADRPGQGNLLALELESRTLVVQPNIEAE
jgi:serine/threonine protein phosphatase 1